MSRAVKKKKSATIDDIEAMALKGKDTDMYFSKPKRMPPQEVRRFQRPGILQRSTLLLQSHFCASLIQSRFFSIYRDKRLLRCF